MCCDCVTFHVLTLKIINVYTLLIYYYVVITNSGMFIPVLYLLNINVCTVFPLFVVPGPEPTSRVCSHAPLHPH